MSVNVEVQTPQPTPPVAPLPTPPPAPVVVAQPSPAPAPPAPADPAPGPVPYARFHEVNTRASTLEAENAQLKSQLTANGQSATQQLQTERAKWGAETNLRVLLARNGVVSDPYADYLVGEYSRLGTAAPPPNQWVEQQRTQAPAFFSASAAPVVAPAPIAAPAAVQPAPAPPAATPPAPPAPVVASPPAPIRTSPDTGANGVPPAPTQDPPLTRELIDRMDMATYTRRRSEIQAFLKAQRRR